MRPLSLKGHNRPVTFVKYNKDGDLLFSCSNDGLCTVWFSDDGERLGTFSHRGAVTSCDVDLTSTRVLTSSKDGGAYLWNVRNGELITKFDHGLAPVAFIQFAEGCRRFVTCTENKMGKDSAIHIFELPPAAFDEPPSGNLVKDTPTRIIQCEPKISLTCVVWGPLNKTIIASDATGNIYEYDAESGELLGKYTQHTKRINFISMSKDKFTMLTCSDDWTAKLWDVRTKEVLKVFKTEKPVNCVALSPLKNHILTGGGQDASVVTTTSVGQFEVTIFHKVFEEPIGTIKGHFGPINALDFSPDGRGYTSGGEDGYVRVHRFDQDYFKLKDA